MNRRAAILYKGVHAGMLAETDAGYIFAYAPEYLARPDAQPVSLTLPLGTEPVASKGFPPFFDGLIPEGWLLDIVAINWKINPRDRMGLLLVCCRDCIGAVSVEAADENV